MEPPTLEQIISGLSDREREIAHLLAWDNVQKQIADKLSISPSTVSTHLRNIYRKMKINKETTLVRIMLFHEYGIADNPFKKVCAIICLAVMLSTFATHSLGFRFNRTVNRTISEVREVRVRTGRTLTVRFNRLKVA